MRINSPHPALRATLSQRVFPHPALRATLSQRVFPHPALCATLSKRVFPHPALCATLSQRERVMIVKSCVLHPLPLGEGRGEGGFPGRGLG
ncbi:MAG TPA: hypothetical protein VMJ66_10640 [Geobacteraceae bacterium]|nr:hypothetical protein [Geobacteraceae bacterium]